MVGKAFAGPFPEDRFYVRAIVAILLPFWHWDLPCFRRRLAVLGTARDGRNMAFNLCKLAKHYAATAAGFIFSGI